MKKIRKAFTLIELIVGVSLSMLLMISVGLFVNNGMQNILSGQKSLKNTSDFVEFSNNLQKQFNLIQSGSFSPINTSSGIIFKIGQDFGNGGFSYIGTETLSGVYCNSDSENSETKNIFIKNFIPFEENGENIFDNYNLILTGSITNGSNTYISYQKKHKITKNGINIIGKGIFGDKFTEGTNGTGVYLNSPTGLAMSGSNILFISDTLNNRVLYYKISENEIYKLLDETDGLNEPTGLYYDDYILYIANSGNGEILKYSSKNNVLAPELTMSGFSEDINEIHLSFSGSNSVNLTNTGIWIITGNSTNPNYLTGTINNLNYYFITKNTETVQPSCTGTETIFSNGKPSIYCTKAGSGQTTNYPISTITKIKIDNLNDFSATGSYYVNLELYENSTKKYSKYFPYFTQSDNNLTTSSDNTLEILYSGLNYPTGIWGTGNTDFIEFLDGTFNDKTLNYHTSDVLLRTPISNLTISNLSNNLITLILKYYKSYDCYNSDIRNERTFILKKNLR